MPACDDRLSYAARWKRLGVTLASLSEAVEKVQVTAAPTQATIVVKSLVLRRPTGILFPRRSTPLFDITTTYTIFGSKDIHVAVAVNNLYSEQATEPLTLPRQTGSAVVW